MKTQDLAQRAVFRTDTLTVEPGGSRLRAAQQDACGRRGTIQNRLPFFTQRSRIVRAHPVHVIEQHEATDAFVGCLQEARNRVGVYLDAVDEAGLEPLEVAALEVFGTAILGIAAGQVDAPEIIVAEWQLAKHVLH